VELLVVIAIIGILVALLLPAIQASRESARRASCTNNMRQLIIAVHDYELAHEHYPAGTVNPQGPIRNVPVGHHISWIARILPYFEENVLYNNLDLSLSAYHHKNDRARQTTISILVCPSEASDEWPYSNYAGCHHDVEAPIDVDNRGVFFLNSQVTRDDLKDGATYTLFLGEKHVDDADLGWLAGTSGTLRNTGTPLNTTKFGGGTGLLWLYTYGADDSEWDWSQQQIDPLTGEIVEMQPEDYGKSADEKGAAPADDAPREDSVVAGGVTHPELVPDANGMLPHSKQGGNPTTPLAVGGFSSRHPAGVNFALGDGSVRFIVEDATAGLMGRLANRADGKIIDAREW
jgi:prepilin-type processing-associated H-X9-DG protein